jgi:hypothetical protein
MLVVADLKMVRDTLCGQMAEFLNVITGVNGLNCLTISVL